jgi:hypothetical protein
MQKIGWAIGAALLFCSSCSQDVTFEKAKEHKCNLEKYAAVAKAAPDDTKAMDDVTQTTMLLNALVEHAPDPAKLRTRLAAHVCSK